MNQLSRTKRILILNLLLEGNTIRATSRLADVAIDTVKKLLVDADRVCRDFHRENVKNVEVKGWVEADELWNFVYCKEKNLHNATNLPHFAGHCWTHVAIDSVSKLIISYRIGKRKPSETERLFLDVKKRVAGGKPPITTDGYPPYSEYAKKVFGNDVSLANIIGPDKHRISGNPDMENTGTIFVERHNATMRMHIRRYARKTHAFSKKVQSQRAHLHLYVTWFNWCRVHKTLRYSPAMAAGLIDRMLDVGFIVDLVKDAEDPPNRPAKYKKRTR